MATRPPAAAEAAVLGPTSKLTRRVEIYESDGVTPWAGGSFNNRLIDGSVGIDYTRDERRSIDLTLDNTDFGLKHDPDGFWYDKVMKVYYGVEYVDTTPTTSYKTRTNMVWNPKFAQTATNMVEVRRNLCTNPNLNVDASGWTNYTGIGTVAVDATAAYSGANGGVATVDGTSVYPRVAHSLTGAVAVADIVTVSTRIRKRGTWTQNPSTPGLVLRGSLTAGGEWVGNGATTTSAPDANGWVRISQTATVAAGASGNLTVNIGISCNAAEPAGAKFEWDEVLIEKAKDSLPYFDGSTPADAALGWDYVWVGTANASASQMRGRAFQYNLNNYAASGVYGGATLDGALRMLTRGGIGSGLVMGFHPSTEMPCVVGGTYAMKCRIRQIGGTVPINVAPRLAHYDASFVENLASVIVTLPADGSWVDVDAPCLIPVSTTAYATPSLRTMVYSSGAYANAVTIEVRDIEVEQVSGVGKSAGSYFDGTTQAFGNRVYAFSGAANASTSVETITVTTPTAVRTTWETQIGEFMIDNISEDHFPYTTKVVGRDYTKKCMLSKFVNPTAFIATSKVEDVVKAIAQNAGIYKFVMPLTGQTLGQDYFFERNTSRWEAMKQIASAFGYELFFDAQGYLVMRAYQDPVTSPLAYSLETGQYGTLVSYSKSVNDTRVFNHIVVTGESTDQTTLPVMAESLNTDTGSPTRIAKIGDRVYPVSSPFVTTTAQAQALADTYLSIMGLEEFDLNFSAISLFWLEVGEIIEFLDPREFAAQPTRFLLSSLSLPLGLGPMSGNGKRVSIVS